MHQLSSPSMKKRKRSLKKMLSRATILLFLALLLLFPTSSLNGAKTGLLLWFNTLLPTLLPFIIVSNLIVSLKITKPLSKILYPIFHKLFGVSKNGCYPILIGMISGIPVGGKSIGDMVENGSLSVKEGQYLLGFCNNASPMFIMGYVAITQLQMPNFRIPLLLFLYLCALLTSILWLKLFSNRAFIRVQDCDVIMDNDEDSVKFDFNKVDDAIMNGFDVITKVGGYVILFSIMAKIISDINGLSDVFKGIVIGFLEITTGIHHIATLDYPIELKIALITGITAFGGLSGLAQTNSVISNTRLSIITYFKIKLAQMLIAFVTMYVLLYIFPLN